MTVYTPGQGCDLGLLVWYMQLWQCEDMDKLLDHSLWSLSAFMRHFTDPNAILFYIEDEGGWYAAAWVFPMASGGSWGLWIRKDKRFTGNRDMMNFIMETLAHGLDKYPVLVNATKQAEIVEKTERLGYTNMGKIPGLFDGQDCYLLYMTREQFAPKLEAWRRYYGRRQDRHARNAEVG